MSMQNACWFFPSRGIEVAALEDPVDLEADALERAPRERDDVLVREERVEVDRAVGRRLLEEGIGVVPRTQLGDRAAERCREPLVERALPARERLGRDPVGLAERLDQLPLVQLVGREREREPVAISEPAGGLVPEACELADVVCDLGADGLRRLPRLLPLGRVVALAEDALDLGVADLDARRRRRDAARSACRPTTRARRSARAGRPGPGA